MALRTANRRRPLLLSPMGAGMLPPTRRCVLLCCAVYNQPELMSLALVNWVARLQLTPCASFGSAHQNSPGVRVWGVPN